MGLRVSTFNGEFNTITNYSILCLKYNLYWKEMNFIYLYTLRGLRKLVMTSENIKNTLNLIRYSLFLKKKKNRVKIAIQKQKTTRETFFLKISTHSLFKYIYARLIYFCS